MNSLTKQAKLDMILKCMPKKIENRMLPLLPYIPTVVPKDVVLPVKYPKKNIDMMGPERVHNQLIYQQCGIIALGGGALRDDHYDIIRDRINKYTDFERFFAVWRVDPPWKPKSKRSLNKKMGGGKAKVDRKSTRLNSSHSGESRMPSSA